MPRKNSNIVARRLADGTGLAHISAYIPETLGKWFRVKAAKLGMNKTELLTIILQNAKENDK